MAARPSFALLLAGSLLSLGAGYRTQNFQVDAPTAALAQQIGQYAEHYRREKAQLWLGQEMPPWSEPCPLKVTVTNNGSGGATSFAFDRGRILGMDMHIEGTPDRLLASVLPHEVTHTVFAHYFRCPVPRWADEGGSVLSEDEVERKRHDQLVRNILNTPGRAIPLRRLLGLMKYPPDVMVLYAEGYSVTEYLVGMSSRPAFLAFIAQGMRYGWDNAVQSHYRFNSVEEMEQAWLANLRQTKQQPANTLLASGRGPNESNRVVVRQTVPPSQPFNDGARPVYRGQMQGDGDDGFDSRGAGQPAFLPEPSASMSSGGGWRQAPASPAPSPSGVRLGIPQFEGGSQPPRIGEPVFSSPGTPVGYPR